MTAKQIICSLLCLAGATVLSSEVKAGEDNKLLPIYGNACEKIKKGEPKSSTRVRVTDMACYAAAENIPEIQSLKSKLNDHDFSMLVYNIVDNYLEALSFKTLVEDGREMCVEVKGGISPKNLQNVWEYAENELNYAGTDEPDETIVADNKQDEEKATNLVVPDSNNEFAHAKIYFLPTHFYNGTKSNNLANVLKEFFSSQPNIKIAETKNEADYTIHSEVLRARIDQINEEKNRLQMVVSLELRDKDGKTIITEHQTRFILFAIEDNEQEIAFRLLKKLFKNAAQLLYKRIERESGWKQQ